MARIDITNEIKARSEKAYKQFLKYDPDEFTAFKVGNKYYTEDANGTFETELEILIRDLEYVAA